MDKTLIEQFKTALSESIEEAFSMILALSPKLNDKEPLTVNKDGLICSIDFEGTLTGAIAITLSQQAACQLASKMLDIKIAAISHDVHYAVGEFLATIVSGTNIRLAVIPHIFEAGQPVICKNNEWKIPIGDDTRLIKMGFECEEFEFGFLTHFKIQKGAVVEEKARTITEKEIRDLVSDSIIPPEEKREEPSPSSPSQKKSGQGEEPSSDSQGVMMASAPEPDKKQEQPPEGMPPVVSEEKSVSQAPQPDRKELSFPKEEKADLGLPDISKPDSPEESSSPLKEKEGQASPSSEDSGKSLPADIGPSGALETVSGERSPTPSEAPVEAKMPKDEPAKSETKEETADEPPQQEEPGVTSILKAILKAEDEQAAAKEVEGSTALEADHNELSLPTPQEIEEPPLIKEQEEAIEAKGLIPKEKIIQILNDLAKNPQEALSPHEVKSALGPLSEFLPKETNDDFFSAQKEEISPSGDAVSRLDDLIKKFKARKKNAAS